MALYIERVEPVAVASTLALVPEQRRSLEDASLSFKLITRPRLLDWLIVEATTLLPQWGGITEVVIWGNESGEIVFTAK